MAQVAIEAIYMFFLTQNSSIFSSITSELMAEINNELFAYSSTWKIDLDLKEYK